MQVTVWLEIKQFQFVELPALAALVGVKPDGSVSVTVTVPLVEALPVFVTEIVYVPVDPCLKLAGACDFEIDSTGNAPETNVAVAERAWVIDTVHVTLVAQAVPSVPDQPVNADPEAAVAVNVTLVPSV